MTEEMRGTESETGRAPWRGPVIGILLILVIACAVVVGSIHWINLIDETHLAASPREGPVDAAAVIHLTEEDFRDHPALTALILDGRNVLVSKGPFFDLLLRLDPRSAYNSGGSEPTKYSSLRISEKEMRQVLAKYALCEWNGTVYGVAQSL